MQNIQQNVEFQSEILCESVDNHNKTLVVIGYQRVHSQAGTAVSGTGSSGEVCQEYLSRQLRWMKDNVEVLSEADLRYCLAQPRAFPSRGVLLTFDGGYRTTFDLAYPVLHDEGLPALLFVPSWLLVERRMGWWDIVSYLVNGTRLATMEWDGASYVLADESRRATLIAVLRDHVMALQEDNIPGFLEELAKLLETDLPLDTVQDDALMTFDQLRAMAAGGMDIGAHPNTQRMLATQKRELHKQELIQAKRILEDQLGKRVRSLAHHMVREDAFVQYSGQLAHESGFELAFSCHTGFSAYDSIDPYNIRRCFKHEPFDAFTETILYPHRVFQPV